MEYADVASREYGDAVACLGVAPTSWRRCHEVSCGLSVVGLPIGVSAKTGDRPTPFLPQGFVGPAEWNDRIRTPAKTPGRHLLPLLTWCESPAIGGRFGA